MIVDRIRFRPGGLMRCCELTLGNWAAHATELPKEGDKLACQYHPNDGKIMIFRDGAWEWIGPKGGW